MDAAAVILAGGKSVRMGRDKGGLDLGGEEMLSRLAGRFQREFGQVWIAGGQGLPDLRPGQGPLAGLETALVRTGAERVFLTAVDMPFADPVLARLLVERMGEKDVCLLRREGGKPEPLFAAYRRTCLPHIRACLDEGRRAMGALLERLDCRVIPERELTGFDLERILFNMNTPEDYRRAKEILNSSLQ